MAKFVRKAPTKRVKRKFTIFATEEPNEIDETADNYTEENEVNSSEDKEDIKEEQNNEQ